MVSEKLRQALLEQCKDVEFGAEHLPEPMSSEVFHLIRIAREYAALESLRLAGQDRGEGYRETLENIANGRQPSPSGSPLACTQLDEIRRYARATLSTQPPPVSDVRPIPMLLWCPQCHTQHIDEPDERTPDWRNPPHRSHLCHACGCIWRPADVPTEGVAAIETKGKADTFDARQALAHAAVGEGWQAEAERQTELAKVYRRAQLTAEEKLCREEANVRGWKKRAEYLEGQIATLSAAPRPIQAEEGK